MKCGQTTALLEACRCLDWFVNTRLVLPRLFDEKKTFNVPCLVRPDPCKRRIRVLKAPDLVQTFSYVKKYCLKCMCISCISCLELVTSANGDEVAQPPSSLQYLSLTFEHVPIKNIWLDTLSLRNLRSPHKLLALQYKVIEPNHENWKWGSSESDATCLQPRLPGTRRLPSNQESPDSDSTWLQLGMIRFTWELKTICKTMSRKQKRCQRAIARGRLHVVRGLSGPTCC